MTEITIVTMFFNLKRLPDNVPLLRPLEFYIENGKKTLDLPYPMVIFCDSDTRPFLQSYRKHPTIYVEKSIADYEFFQILWPTVVENRKHKDVVCNRNTPSYFLMCMFKFHAIQLAHQLTKTQHYAWVDLGASHVVKDFESSALNMLAAPMPRASFCYIHYRGPKFLYPLEKTNAMAAYCGIACTVFTVEAAYVERLYTGTFSILYDHIGKGFGHADEQIVTYLFDKQPELFRIYYGDYSSVLLNYHKSVTDHRYVIEYFAKNAKLAGREYLSLMALDSIV